jgi:hypothetical protein
MSQSRNLPQSKEALLKFYNSRLKDDVKSMLENFEGKYGAYLGTFTLESIAVFFFFFFF